MRENIRDRYFLLKILDDSGELDEPKSFDKKIKIMNSINFNRDSVQLLEKDAKNN